MREWTDHCAKKITFGGAMKKILLLAILSSVVARCGQQQFEGARENMVQSQIVARGVTDSATLRAMRTVLRHEFVPPQWMGGAYADSPLPIGYGQTISQPYIVALMTELIKPHKSQRVLEIGTGSGYQAAVLAEIVDSVYTIELIPELAASSAERLKRLGYRNIVVREGDGYQGWEEHAPFEAILVTAASEEIPRPLIEQLSEGGVMVIPVGPVEAVQALTLVRKQKNGIITRTILPVRFVPLIHPR
jgi:protein-L-isoaspartate(D-aspartate) O-methyltransferase